MRKLTYQTKFMMYHIAIMLFIILCTVAFFYTTVVGEMREREEQSFRILAEKTATQLDSLYMDMDKVALSIAANPDIVNTFQLLPKQSTDNYFTQQPIIKGEVKKLLGSYNFKMDGYSRICLYNAYDDFVSTSN